VNHHCVFCRFVAVGVLLVLATGAHAQPDPVRGTRDANLPSATWDDLTAGSPWVFLGDSNTYAGGYVAHLEARLKQTVPHLKLLNLGVSSETASGLSEVDHPFKRPCVHERLDKVLRMTRPGVVFACYGMNDGIYDPPNAERMQAYQQGMLDLAHKVTASGARLIVLTPPIFEPEPVAAKGKFGPTKEGRYAYFAPYQRYDDVLQQQADWCLTNPFQATAVLDIRTMLIQAKQQSRTSDPTFNYSGDGVHFGEQAHALIAELILDQLHAPTEIASRELTAGQLAAAVKRTKLLRDAYLSATGKNRPGLPAGHPIWMAEQLAKAIEE
jgi:lysophospholipase L1-like esterase